MFLGRGLRVFFIVALQLVTYIRRRVNRKVSGKEFRTYRKAVMHLGLAQRPMPLGRSDSTSRNNAIRKPLHFFHLRTELKQQKIDAGFLEFSNAVSHLLRRGKQACASSPIRNGILF